MTLCAPPGLLRNRNTKSKIAAKTQGRTAMQSLKLFTMTISTSSTFLLLNPQVSKSVLTFRNITPTLLTTQCKYKCRQSGAYGTSSSVVFSSYIHNLQQFSTNNTPRLWFVDLSLDGDEHFGHALLSLGLLHLGIHKFSNGASRS